MRISVSVPCYCAAGVYRICRLENAIEACKRMTEGERFITLNSRVQHGTLTITMDNSFDGNYKEKGGMFYSRKHDGEGIGLSSELAVARKYGGNAGFEAKGNVFLSSVYVKMGEPETAAEQPRETDIN